MIGDQEPSLRDKQVMVNKKVMEILKEKGKLDFEGILQIVKYRNLLCHSLSELRGLGRIVKDGYLYKLKEGIK